ncbi:MAG: hypothetical protein GX455_05475, partial [Phycisphaerae bacterium]|nr:hypothetical protein [Phycisphaerae bacterium]
AAMGPIPATVSAGPDGTFQFRPEIEFPLQGSVTDYGKPDGKIILWTTADGPAEVTFSDPGSPTSTAKFSKAGIYTLKLTVIDDTGTVEDTATITAVSPTCADVTNYFPTDLNKDCRVNLADFALIAAEWLKCNDPEDEDCIWPF